jgi:hypothetical protein
MALRPVLVGAPSVKTKRDNVAGRTANAERSLSRTKG